MSGQAMRRTVGVLAVAVPSAMGLFFVLLTARFDYPHVVALPAGEVLPRLGHVGFEITTYWAGVTLSALLLVALVIGLDRVIRHQAAGHDRAAARLPYLSAITVTGILAALCMALDLGQWTWRYPHLGHRYLDPSTTAALRGDLETTWVTYHRYLGEMIGIYAATLFSAIWAVGASWVLLPTRHRLGRIAWLGVAAGLIYLVSIAPGVRFETYAALNSAGFVVWFAWLAASGGVLLRERQTHTARAR